TGRYVPRGPAAAVLAFVRERGVTHPREVQAEFGDERVVNGWGGSSLGTTMILDKLHHHGLLRVARRESGIRLYEAAPPLPRAQRPQRRVRDIVLVVARILAPVPVASLSATVNRLVTAIEGGTARAAIRRLVAAGDLVSARVADLEYVWPAELAPVEAEPAERVRILAPFDPVVWDRRRFEHVWGWAYRFEAYTPAPKRVLGYYAMPLLWRDRVIGWANCGRDGSVELGFVEKDPRERAFSGALDDEIERLRHFLGTGADGV
ncbi:MAG TPA: crosslink repair DNA glycosylase YcaQ family protein, partial [Actinoplanes sp.]|nr:crosslink repair DNA glycosylase YcaQ family protein [Actinoplanes sp.]